MATAPSINDSEETNPMIASCHVDGNRLYLVLNGQIDDDMPPTADDFSVATETQAYRVNALDVQFHNQQTVLLLLLDNPIEANCAIKLKYVPQQWMMCWADTGDGIEPFDHTITTSSADLLDPTLRLKANVNESEEKRDVSANNVAVLIRTAYEFLVQVEFNVHLQAAIPPNVNDFRAELEDRWLSVTQARYVKTPGSEYPVLLLELSERLAVGERLVIGYRSPSKRLRTIDDEAIPTFSCETIVEAKPLHEIIDEDDVDEETLERIREQRKRARDAARLESDQIAEDVFSTELHDDAETIARKAAAENASAPKAEPEPEQEPSSEPESTTTSETSATTEVESKTESTVESQAESIAPAKKETPKAKPSDNISKLIAQNNANAEANNKNSEDDIDTPEESIQPVANQTFTVVDTNESEATIGKPSETPEEEPASKDELATSDELAPSDKPTTSDNQEAKAPAEKQETPKTTSSEAPAIKEPVVLDTARSPSPSLVNETDEDLIPRIVPPSEYTGDEVFTENLAEPYIDVAVANSSHDDDSSEPPVTSITQAVPTEEISQVQNITSANGKGKTQSVSAANGTLEQSSVGNTLFSRYPKWVFVVPGVVVLGLVVIVGINVANLLFGADIKVPSTANSTSAAQSNNNQGTAEVTYKREECILKSADGSVYEGMCAAGQRDGKGVYTWASGNRYEGDWLGGKRHGKGKLTYSTGAVYEGEYRAGREHGTGKMKWPNGASYEGGYRDGRFHGQGTYRSASGNQYRGEFNDGSMTENGTCTMQSGDSYPGPCRAK